MLGAAEALATGNNALAGAAGAATGEVAAKLITEQLYNTTPDKLSEAQKDTVSALSQLASGLSGVLAGDNTASGITAAQSGKSAVENNYLFKQGATRQSELLAKQQKEGLTKEEKDELSELHKRDIERDNNLQTACHLGMTSTCANELISLSNAFHSYGNPKDELQNNSIRSEYLDVAMKYSEAKRQYAEDVAREALSKIASENITNSTELVKITAKAITGDEASQSQLHEMGQAIKAFVQSPVGVISDNIKAELAEADRLESQGLIREADVKRMQVYLSTELGVLGSASGLSNVAIVGSKVAIKGANMATKELHSLGKLASTSTKETLDRGGNIIGPSGNMLNNKYTYLGDGMFIGPNGGKIVNTGRVDKTTGNVIFQRVTDDNSYVNQFVMIDNNGLQISVPRPSGLKNSLNQQDAPIHHICTDKNCISTVNGGPWTPRFEKIFNGAGLSFRDAANKVKVAGHQGPHPKEYHQDVYQRLIEATEGVPFNTPEYRRAVESTLERIGKEAQTPGTQVNKWLTKE